MFLLFLCVLLLLTRVINDDYANEAARVLQDLCKSCRVPVILLYFILLQMGEPLNSPLCVKFGVLTRSLLVNRLYNV